MDETSEKSLNLSEKLILLKIHFKTESNVKEIRRKFSTRKSVLSSTRRLSQSITLNEKAEAKINTIVKNLGFIYRGYKEDCFYWEILLFSRKFLLVMIGILTEAFPSQTKDVVLFFILICYWLLQFQNDPFAYHYLNTLEMGSLNISLIMTFIGMMLSNESVRKVSIVLVILVFVMNAWYIGYWLYCLQHYGKVGGKLKSYFMRLKKKFI